MRHVDAGPDGCYSPCTRGYDCALLHPKPILSRLRCQTWPLFQLHLESWPIRVSSGPSARNNEPRIEQIPPIRQMARLGPARLAVKATESLDHSRGPRGWRISPLPIQNRKIYCSDCADQDICGSIGVGCEASENVSTWFSQRGDLGHLAEFAPTGQM